jgi:hypothetical protein
MDPAFFFLKLTIGEEPANRFKTYSTIEHFFQATARVFFRFLSGRPGAPAQICTT